MAEEEEPSRTEGCQQAGSALPERPLSPQKEGEQEVGSAGRVERRVPGWWDRRRALTHSLVICATFSMAV